MHAFPHLPTPPFAARTGTSRAATARRPVPVSPDPARSDTLGESCGLDIEMGALLRFKSMMALEGETVQVARMCYDTAYAHDRIAQAHASGRDVLQRLALELFQAYHRRSVAGREPAAA